MFPDRQLVDFLKPHHKALLQQLLDVERHLNGRFYHMEKPIRAVILAAAAGEPLLLVGSPGTAKSLLIREFCLLLGMNLKRKPGTAPDENYFEYLLTSFTEPGELFGHLDVSLLREGEYKRKDKGMMQKARVVYLDEVFNASSAVLNAILAVLNEGIFHSYGQIIEVKKECLFAATNTFKNTQELKAFSDRFILRCWLENVPSHSDALGPLVETGWVETFGENQGKCFPKLLDDLKAFREQIETATKQQELRPDPDHELFGSLSCIVDYLRRNGYSEMSNRRLVKMSRIMLIHALLRAVKEGHSLPRIDQPELELIPDYFVDRHDDQLNNFFHTVQADWKHKQAIN